MIKIFLFLVLNQAFLLINLDILLQKIKNLNQVSRFIEKPNQSKAKKLYKKEDIGIQVCFFKKRFIDK